MLIAVVAMFSINYFPVWALPIIDVSGSVNILYISVPMHFQIYFRSFSCVRRWTRTA